MKLKLSHSAEIMSAVAAAALLLTGQSALAGPGGITPATTTLGPTTGTPYYQYTPSTGDLTWEVNGATGTIQELDILSAGGNLLYNNANTGSPTAFTTQDANEVDLETVSGAYPNGFDVGDILNDNVATSSLLSDLTLLYSVKGQSGPDEGEFVAQLVVPATPEPASLSLLGVGAVALLGRRRRRTA